MKRATGLPSARDAETARLRRQVATLERDVASLKRTIADQAKHVEHAEAESVRLRNDLGAIFAQCSVQVHSHRRSELCSVGSCPVADSRAAGREVVEVFRDGL